MGRRIPAENARRSTAATAPPATAADASLVRAQLFLEAARVALRAREEAVLARTLCALLVQPALYAEACIAFLDDTLPARRSSPVPADECAVFMADPARIFAVIDSVGTAAEHLIPVRI